MAFGRKSYSYADKKTLNREELRDARTAGVRFRSRPGAPLAAGTGTSTPVPEATATANADWGRKFGRNSVFGGRGGPQPAATSPSPTPFSARTPSTSFGIKQPDSVFKPSPPVPFTLGGETDATPLVPESSGGFGFGATGSPQPGFEFGAGMDTPDAVKSKTIQDLEKWHADNGVPLPEQAGLTKQSDSYDYVTGQSASNYTSRYGTASVSTPKPPIHTRLARLNTDGQFPDSLSL